MGFYNEIGRHETLPSIKDNKCPICDNEFNPLLNANPGKDSFEIECKSCGEGKIIQISGSVLISDNFNKIINNTNVKVYLMNKIANCKDVEVQITSLDFP